MSTLKIPSPSFLENNINTVNTVGAGLLLNKNYNMERYQFQSKVVGALKTKSNTEFQFV